ncbi:hypothetical protein [Thermogemmatispora tikiterensis]|uniref:PKD domain-containing protein n=1 Tax=Thermogemmatispora tikiterensis TaxID=1825093 RepID=A0A328VLR7_9CHLR|nr:hypothetical protein [Thermogemmatispora tikiterensis]RAQ97801.1 hypothetical protein A4R35_19835 [Thermogemmatispora tikiterensis]
MKRISALLLSLSAVCCLLLSLALTVLLGAAPVHAASGAPEATVPVASGCLAAAPSKQQVAVGQPAHIVITVSCYPAIPSPIVIVDWGDGSLSKYPVCAAACPVPPVELVAAHSYAKAGTYQPLICLSGEGPITPLPECVSVEVIVVPLTPQPLS